MAKPVVAADRRRMSRGSALRRAETEPQGQRWAVVIGISKYRDPNIRPLRFAAADARAICDLLSEPAYGKLDPSRTQLLIDEDATFLNVRRALRSFLKRPAAEDSVMIYLACHGAHDPADERKRVFLLNYDTDANDLLATATPLDDLTDAIESTLKADRVTLVVDACYADAFTDKRSAEASIVQAEFLKRAAKSRPGVAILTAAQRNQTALEGAEWNGHGIFTHYLLEGLRGAAKASGETNDVIQLGDLFDYVRNRVETDTEKRQIPELRAKGSSRAHVMGYVGMVNAQRDCERGDSLLALGKRLNERSLLDAAARAYDAAIIKVHTESELWVRAQVGRFCARVSVSATPEQFRTVIAGLDTACGKSPGVMQHPQTLLHLGMALPKHRRDYAGEALAARAGAFERAAVALEQFATNNPANPAQPWAVCQAAWLKQSTAAYAGWQKNVPKRHALLVVPSRMSPEQRANADTLTRALIGQGVRQEDVHETPAGNWVGQPNAKVERWLARVSAEDSVLAHIVATTAIDLDALLTRVLERLEQIPAKKLWLAVDGLISETMIERAERSGRYSLLALAENPDGGKKPSSTGMMTELLAQRVTAAQPDAELKGDELARPIVRALSAQGLAPVYVEGDATYGALPVFALPDANFIGFDRLSQSIDRLSPVAIGKPLPDADIDQLKAHQGFLDRQANRYGDGYAAIGRSLLAKGLAADAQIAFDRALGVQLSNRAETLAECVDALCQLKRPAEAAALLVELGQANLDASDPDAATRLRAELRALAFKPLCETLRTDLRRREDLKDLYPEGRLTLGIALVAFQSQKEAIALLQRAIALFTDPSIAIEQGRRGTPVEQCLQQARFHLGRVLLELNDDLFTAASELNAAYKSDPNDDAAFRLYADALAKLLDGPELERALTQKLQSDATFHEKLEDIMKQVIA